MHYSRAKFRSLISTVCALLLATTTAFAADAPKGEEIKLWPDGAPGAVGDEPSDQPTIVLYRAPENIATGAAVIICPGGGYITRAENHEGHQIAEWFNSLGVTGVMLRYRHAPKYKHPTPMLDAQRAVRFVRSNAKEWSIDPNRIGMMGFSAGGHLASTVGTHFDDGDAHSTDVIERAGCRPDFLILCYPVITIDRAHVGSRKALLGDDPPQELLDNLSNDRQVTDRTPPTFLFHTSDDLIVPAENSVHFYLALRKAGVPAELHIYESGPHGVGLALQNATLKTWPDLLVNWLRVRGVVPKQ